MFEDLEHYLEKNWVVVYYTDDCTYWAAPFKYLEHYKELLKEEPVPIERLKLAGDEFMIWNGGESFALEVVHYFQIFKSGRLVPPNRASARENFCVGL